MPNGAPVPLPSILNVRMAALQAWVQSYVYMQGDRIIANNAIYAALYGGGQSASSGTGPSGTGLSGPSGTSSPVPDGTCQWTYVAPFGTPAAWSAQNYGAKSIVVDTNGHYWITLAGGNSSGASFPALPTLGATYTDGGSVVWIYVAPWTATQAYTGTPYIYANSNVYSLAQAGTSATGLVVLDPPSGGATAIQWQYLGVSAPQWVAGTPYAQGAQVSNSGKTYVNLNAGTSGANGPSGTGNQIIDGGCVWAYVMQSSAVVAQPVPGLADVGAFGGGYAPAGFFNWLWFSTYRFCCYVADLCNQAFTWTNSHVFSKLATFNDGLVASRTTTNADAITGTGAGSGNGVVGKSSGSGSGVTGVTFGTGTGPGVQGFGNATSGQTGVGGQFVGGGLGNSTPASQGTTNDAIQGTGGHNGNGAAFTGNGPGAGVVAKGGSGGYGVDAQSAGANAVNAKCTSAAASVYADSSGGTGNAIIAKGNSTSAPLYLNPQGTPSAGFEGDLYYDNLTHQLLYYNGSIWVPLLVPTQVGGSSADGGKLVETLSGGTIDPTLMPPLTNGTLTAGTDGHSNSTALSANCGCSKDASGVVHLKGSITVPLAWNPATLTGWSQVGGVWVPSGGVALATLPAGFRPTTGTLCFSAVTQGGGVDSLYIDTSGNICAAFQTNPGASGPCTYYLDDISFDG